MKSFRCLSNSGKSKLFRSLNNFHKFGVVIHQNRVNPNIFNNKKTKQRYLDYAFKIAIKRKFEALIREGTIEPCKVSKIRFYVDEHATATDGRYELREALEQEFKIGTFNLKWSVFHEPIFPNLQSVEEALQKPSLILRPESFYLLHRPNFCANDCSGYF